MDILEKLKAFDKSQIIEAIAIQERLQYFSIPFSEAKFAPQYHQTILDKIERKISNKRAFNTFKENIQYPLSTCEFINTIFTSLSKVFTGDGKTIEFYPSGNYKTLGFQYLQTKIWDRFIVAPNTLIVTTKDKDVTKRFFVDITCVEYIECEENDITAFAYKSEQEIIYIDSVSVYKIKDNRITDEQKHNFGFCPVAFISNIKLSHKKPLIRINPLVKSLGKIEELFIVSTQSNIINRHILPYVIETKKVGKGAGCNYANGNTYCENGYLYIAREGEKPNIIIDENQIPMKCPVCNKEVGFGSVLEFNANNLDSDSIAKVADSILNYKHLPVESLKFASEKERELETQIYNKIVNKQDSLNNQQQHNEVRIRSTYEDKEAVLINLKKVFEALLSKLITFDLKIKSKGYENTYVSLGSKFYLLSASEYQELIEKAKKTNINDYLTYERGLIEVQYQENPEARNRYLFLHELELAVKPFRNLSHEDVIKLYESGKVTKNEFLIYTDLNRLIRDIEIQEGKNIMDMYPDKTMNEQIKLITQKLYNYGKE